MSAQQKSAIARSTVEPCLDASGNWNGELQNRFAIGRRDGGARGPKPNSVPRLCRQRGA